MMMDDEALHDNAGPDSGHRAFLYSHSNRVLTQFIYTQLRPDWGASSRAETLRWLPLGPDTPGPHWTIL